MKLFFIISTLCFLSFGLFANVIIVDPNGAIQTIQGGINIAATGDTVKVYPGTYTGQVNLNKDIVLMGSGYENTIILVAANPAVTMNTGKIQWFRVTSTSGDGVRISGGILRNCVIQSCAIYGIHHSSGTAQITQCVILYNGSHGIYSDASVTDNNLYVHNCISYWNTNNGFYDSWYYKIYLSYSNGSRVRTNGNQGCIDTNPNFNSSSDYHIGPGGPCYDTGNPSISDPDGSRSDMGYFGGPDCPIYPVVTWIQLNPLPTGGVQVEATGRANY